MYQPVLHSQLPGLYGHAFKSHIQIQGAIADFRDWYTGRSFDVVVAQCLPQGHDYRDGYQGRQQETASKEI